MFEKIDLSKTMSKRDYKEAEQGFESRIGFLQRRLKEENIPVMIVFEGWDAAGKGTLINRLILPMDPRGFTVHTIHEPNEEERRKPHLWRFWSRIPRRGRMAVFDRSWYRRTFEERVRGELDEARTGEAYDEIRAFERQLTDDGYVLVKLFIHISKEEQKKRFKELESREATSWRVTERDWEQNKGYKAYLEAVEETVRETDTANAPWVVIEGTDRRFASAKMYQAVLTALEGALTRATARREPEDAPEGERQPGSRILNASVLGTADLSLALDKQTYKKRLKKLQKKIGELGYELYRRQIPVVLVYEGWDAAGKGGNIKRLTENLDPRGYDVVPISAPDGQELAHHYLWRFWREMPKTGHIAIFDRSWYGRVLVERVEGLCPEEAWRRAYQEINEMEEHLANFGAVVRKFWLEIDKDEQLSRFRARQTDPLKAWKITEEDWRNREKWEAYQEAVDEMLFRTSTSYAPWIIVESNDKYYARVKVLEEVVEAIEAKL